MKQYEASTKPLTIEDLHAAFEAIKEQSDWMRANPHGTANNRHITSKRQLDRARETGGCAICIECGRCVGSAHE